MEDENVNNEVDMNAVIEDYEQGIEHYGTQVRMNTMECVIWRMEHSNKCQGCPYSLGCLKLNLIFRMLSSKFKANNPLELQLLQASINMDIQNILTAKAEDELKLYRQVWQV